MLVEDLRLVSSTASVHIADSPDDVLVNFTVTNASENGRSIRLVNFSCECVTGNTSLGRVDTSFSLLLYPEATTEAQLEHRLVELAWPYFRQHVLSQGVRFGAELPFECPFVAKQIEPQADAKSSKPVGKPQPSPQPWEKPWEGEVSDYLRVSVLVGGILAEILDRKREWFWSPLRLYTYLALIEDEAEFTLNVAVGPHTDEVVVSFEAEFQLSKLKWLQLDLNSRQHYIWLVEELLQTSYFSVMTDDADPETSVVPDDFMKEAGTMLNELRGSINQAGLGMKLILDELCEKLTLNIAESLANLNESEKPEHLLGRLLIRYESHGDVDLSASTVALKDGQLRWSILYNILHRGSQALVLQASISGVE